ncbi:NAD(+) diphosphatase [Saccharicrinis sp. GN24d3]|uniref:NAD(+) diphosphatase n=1 Tax=Saccharicrinis sp. GN24d3 TaxID=3458416 RepID=UPI004036747A
MIQDIHPHQFDNRFVAKMEFNENDYVFCFKGNALMMKQSGESLEIPTKKDMNGCASDGVFLFTFKNTPCFLVRDCTAQHEERFVFHDIHFRNPFSEKELDWVASVALQLKNWYDQHKYCGQCGTLTEPRLDERAVVCPSCQNTKYPTISPAIIVAIICNDKILLARGAHFPEGFYSLVAGYVDVGESIEDAVVREVQEEVGVEIKNIRYYKSQPWPFSGSVMIGFVAEAAEEQTIRVDNREILEADWYDRNDLPNYPSNRSIAGEIIDKFNIGEL